MALRLGAPPLMTPQVSADGDDKDGVVVAPATRVDPTTASATDRTSLAVDHATTTSFSLGQPLQPQHGSTKGGTPFYALLKAAQWALQCQQPPG